MTKTQALKEAVQRWGKDAGIEDKGKARASTPENREEAKAKLRELNALTNAEMKARRKDRDHWLSESYRYRYIVGVIGMGMFFCVYGSGDTWEQAFSDADQRHGRKAA